jgi:hypothetical protein
MTLGVAAKFPWPGLVERWPDSIRQVLEAYPRFRPQPAIIMATDSRWTYRTGVDFDDGAVKMVAVSSRAMAIYAGDTVVGPRSLGHLTSELKRQPTTSAAQLARAARSTIQASWRRWSTDESRLEVSIGFCDESLGLRLWRFADRDGFVPHESSGVETIGGFAGRAHFWQTLNRLIDEKTSRPLSEHAFAAHADDWAGDIALALWETCEAGADPEVGGAFLYGYLNGEGLHGRSLHRIDTSRAELSSEQLTLRHEDVEAFQDRQQTRQRPGR